MLHHDAAEASAGLAPGWLREIHLIFSLSDLRIPVPASMASNFMRLHVLEIFNILSAQFLKAAENIALPLLFRGSSRSTQDSPCFWE